MRRIIGVGLAAGLVLALGAAPPAGANTVPGTPSPSMLPLLDPLVPVPGSVTRDVRVLLRNDGSGPSGSSAPLRLRVEQDVQVVSGDGWLCSASDRSCTSSQVVAPGSTSSPLVLRVQGTRLRVVAVNDQVEVPTEVTVGAVSDSLALVLTTADPAHGPQYGRARLQVIGTGGTPGPAVVWLSHDALSASYAGARVWATGSGWTCGSPRPRGLPCTHPGPLAPGAVLPDLYVTRVPPGVVMTAEQDGQPRTAVTRLLLPVAGQTGPGATISTVQRVPGGAVTLRLSRPSWYLVDGAPQMTGRDGRDVATTVSCRPGPCSGGPVTEVVVTPYSYETTVPGEQYDIVLQPPAVSAYERVSTRLFTAAQQGVLAQSWPVARVPGTLGGSESYERLAGATVQTEMTEGGRLFFSTGPDRGLARVLVDGRQVAVLDQWSPTVRHGQSLRVAIPRQTRKTVVLQVLGRKRAASRGTTVSLDGVAYCGLPYRDCQPKDGTQALDGPYTWSPAAGGDSDGVVIRSSPGGVLRTPFFGRGIDVLHTTGPGGGRFGVLVDGRRITTVDTRAATTSSRTSSVRFDLPRRAVLQLVVDSGVVGIDAVVVR